MAVEITGRLQGSRAAVAGLHVDARQFRLHIGVIELWLDVPLGGRVIGQPSLEGNGGEIARFGTEPPDEIEAHARLLHDPVLAH